MKKIASLLPLGLLILSACGSAPSADSALETVVAATLDGMTAVAESSGLPVSYENISFRIPLELNASAKAFTDTQWEFPSVNPSNGPMPAHAIFEFTNYPIPDSAYPAEEGGRIMVFKSSEYAAYDPYQQDIVTALLAGQESAQPIPDALTMGTFYAQTNTVDFQNGHGVRYVTQDMNWIVVNNQALFYYYQGVTNDGAYFVSAIFHVHAPFLVADDEKDSITPPDGVPFGVEPFDYVQYRVDLKEKLNDPSVNFTPSLSILDQLIESMEIVSP